MKKYFIFAVAAVVALAACTKNNVENSGPQEISYNAITAKNQVTKAIISHSFYAPNDPTFGIWGLFQETDWSTNHAAAEANIWVGNRSTGAAAEISNSTGDANGIWRNSTTDYWPLSGKLVFMGYSPYSVANASISLVDENKTAITVSDFSSSPAASWDTDLMYSDPVERTKETATTQYQPDGNTNKYAGVPVMFHHALAQVAVFAKKHEAYSGYTITVTGLSLTIDNKATLTAKGVPDSTPTSCSWVVDETAAAGVKTILDDSEANDDITLTSNTEYTSIGNAFLVIPQILDASAADGYDKLTVTYSLTRNGITTSTSKDINLRVDNTFVSLASNTKYNLKLDIALDEIKYSPDITDWESTEVNQEYSVPQV